MGSVPARLVADPVHHRRRRSARVVEVRDAIGEARAQVQQGRGGLARHARVAIGCPRAHPLEEPKDGTDAPHLVESRHEGKLGGARVREAELDSRRGGGLHEAERAIHSLLL